MKIDLSQPKYDPVETARINDYVRFWCETRYGAREETHWNIESVVNEDGRHSLVVEIDGSSEFQIGKIADWFRRWASEGRLRMIFAIIAGPNGSLYRIYDSLKAFDEEFEDGVNEECCMQIRTLRGG